MNKLIQGDALQTQGDVAETTAQRERQGQKLTPARPARVRTWEKTVFVAKKSSRERARRSEQSSRS